LNHLPCCVAEGHAITAEYQNYHRVAVATWGVQQNLATDARMTLWSFWHNNTITLPTFFRCFRDAVALVPTSSGSIERVFAILEGTIDESQERALEDYKEGATMICYNSGKRRAETSAVMG
jgi:hypothetical protein